MSWLLMNLRTDQRDDIMNNELFVKLMSFLSAQRAIVFFVEQFVDPCLRLVRKLKLADLLARWPTTKECCYLFDGAVRRRALAHDIPPLDDSLNLTISRSKYVARRILVEAASCYLCDNRIVLG